MRRVRLAFIAVLLICVALTLHQFHRPNLADFQVYDTAAALVLHGKSPDLYDDADTGSDPQLKFANPDTVYARQAHRLGIRRVRLYVYPPVLADLAVPFALVGATVGGCLWLAANIAILLLTWWLVLRLLGVHTRLGAAALLVGLFSLFVTGMCLIWGQITIVLLLLWVLCAVWYARGWKVASAAALALAAAIKLTPLLVVAPMLLWRDWKWLRAFCMTLAALAVGILLINGAGPLLDYFRHVVPSMSGGIANAENKSLVSSVQLAWIGLHHGTAPAPAGVRAAARAASAACIVAALALVWRAGRHTSAAYRLLTISLFALLSTAVAPVSWKHGYVVVFLPLAFLWADIFRRRAPAIELILLSLISIELGSFFFDSVEGKLAHGAALDLFSLTAPVSAVLLVLWQLWRMRRDDSAFLPTAR